MLTQGPKFSYFPNATKTYLLVENNLMESAKIVFGNAGISVTSSGRSVLGSPFGSLEFVHHFVFEKVKEWVSQVHVLSVIALPHPQSAFSAFIHGASNKWTYLSLTSSDIDHLFQPLEDAIRVKFLPALTGRDPPNDQVHNLLSLPPTHSGLGLLNPCSFSAFQYKASTAIKLPLVNGVLGESNKSAYEVHCAQLDLISEYKKLRTVKIKSMAQTLHDELPVDLQKQMDYVSEKGASSWVSVLPIQEQNFHMHKSSTCTNPRLGTPCA